MSAISLPSLPVVRRCLVLVLACSMFAAVRAEEKPPQAGDTLPPEIAARVAPGVGAVLKGHTEAIYAIGFTPDGKHIVTASFDKTLKVWDAVTGKEIKTFSGPLGHQNLVLSLAVSPDGASVASGSSDQTAKIWDFPLTTSLRELALADAGTAVAVSPDGKMLAGGGKDGLTKLWNTADGKETFKLAGHTGPVVGLAFSPNGQLLASAGADKTIRYWNPLTGQLVATIGAHAGTPTGVAFNTAGSLLFSSGDDGSIKFWTLPPVASRPLAAPHGDSVTALTLSPDNTQILSGSMDKTVRVSTLANGAQVRSLDAAAPVRSVAMAPNATLIAAGTADQRLVLWNATTGLPAANVFAHGGPVSGLAFHPSSTQLLTAGEDGLVKLWAMPPVAARSLPHPDAVLTATASANGQQVFTGGADKIVRSWNVATPAAPARQFTGHTAPVTAVAVSATGAMLASAGEDEVIRFWNQANGMQTELIGAHAGAVHSLAFNPAGTQLLSSGADGTVKLWQLPTVPPKLYAHPDQVTCAVLSPDGTKLLTGCIDKQARLWNLTTGQVERVLAGNTLAILSVAINAAGTQVAAGGADKSLTVWNVADGKEAKKIAALAAVQSVAFSPDGKFVAGGLADNSVRLFDVTMGKEVKSLAGHTGPVSAVTFTTKGDHVISGSADKTVQVWNVVDGVSKAKIDHGAAVTSLALSKDGLKLASGGADKAVKVWMLADGKAAGVVTTPAEVRGISFSPDGTRLAVAGADNRGRLVSLDSKMLEFFPHEGPVLAVAFHGDGKRIFTASADKTARGWSSALVWQASHAGPVKQALFSPRGVVSAGGDKNVGLWNAADGKSLLLILAHDGPVNGVGVSTDGTKIVSAGADKAVKVWTLPPTGMPAAPVAFTLPAAADAVAISPNGLRVAASVPDGAAAKVRVFDVASAKEIQILPDHAGPVRALSFLADNRTLVTAGADKAARLLDVGVLAAFDAHTGGVSSVAFHSGGTQALTGGADKTVKVWDLATGKMTKSFGPLADPVTAVAYSRDFTQAGAAAGKVVKVWNLADGKDLATLTHPAPVASLSFNADRTRLATAAADRLARVWDVASAQELQAFAHTEPVTGVLFHTNSSNVITASADKTVAIHTLAINRAVPLGTPARSLAVSPNGTHILVAGDDKKVKVVNLGTGAIERSLDGSEGPVTAVAASKNGILIAAAGPEKPGEQADTVVRVYTFADGKLVSSFKAPAPVRSLTFTPNSQGLAAACDDKSIQTWNVAFTPGQLLPAEFGARGQSFVHAGPAADAAFSPDGTALYSTSADKTVKTWKYASDNPTKNLPHPNLVDAVAFNPKGDLLATGCHDGKMRIYDVAKGTVLKEVNAHIMPAVAPIYCVAWTADGKQVLTGSNDSSIKLWDATAGTLVREFKAYKEKDFEKGHRDGVFCVAISPDGKTIASGSSDRTIKLWNVADGSVIRDLANPNLKPSPGAPPQAQPGWVYGVKFTPDGKQLVSVGGASMNRGFLGLWNVADGKMLSGEELPLGVFFALALSTDGKFIAVGSGGNPKAAGQEPVNAYVMPLPAVK